ncbi:hypothetical protein FB451DRAFT_1164601 [Mycena latifolia]|nr:hypothetical protein FB451DRAFT_1164601 [Mycena latifolia]
MDATATHRFVDSNVAWPSDRFFIPDGGLAKFLHENMRFKVFLLMNALFTDAFATATIPSLTSSYRDEVRRRMRDLVRHMFFAAQIRQNEFRIQYMPTPMPSTTAWMFHVVLVLLQVIGFEGDEAMVVTADKLAK